VLKRSATAGRRRRTIPYVLLAPGLLWLLLFFVAPLAIMLVMSLREGTLATGFELTWNFAIYPEAISEFSEQFIRSFWYAGVATVIALFIAYPLAYAIAFRAGKWKNALLFAVIAPFFTTYLIRTLAWTTILDDASPTADVFRFLGIIPEDGRILQTTGAVIMGITYNFLPFMILPIYASLERIDKGLIEAAKDLYASSRQAFLRVTLPLSTPGVVAGVLLMFIPSVGDFINATFLGSPAQFMIGNVIQNRYLNVTDYPTAAALSFILMAMILAAVIVYIRFAGTESIMEAEGGGPERPDGGGPAGRPPEAPAAPRPAPAHASAMSGRPGGAA
jgi:spermidine/putrescine transport system permease protein